MAAARGKVNTATLKRGRTYTYQSIKFERDVPKVIEDDKLLEDLEELYDEVTDDEGEVYEKPRFAIKRNVDAPDDGTRRPNRLKATREVRTVRRRNKG